MISVETKYSRTRKYHADDEFDREKKKMIWDSEARGVVKLDSLVVGICPKD